MFIKTIVIISLLTFSSIADCQENTASISRDPFLLYYIVSFPSIKINVSENVVVQRISYKDFDKKEINFGDAERGTFWHSIYLFQNGVFRGIDNATTKEGRLLLRTKAIEINRNSDGSISSIDQYATGEGRFLRQDSYKKNNNVIIANDGLRSGVICSVLVEEEERFLYYRNYQNYTKVPDEPETIINFINGGVIVDVYDSGPRKLYSRYHFINGILMKREFIGNRTETYTVSSGKGQIIVTKPDGTEIERRMLERRINAAGYLEYEAVRLPSGTGYEYFFTKDTLK
jgi:hypothetical protein